MPRVWLIVAIGLVQLYAFIESIIEPGPRTMPRWAWVVVTGFVPVVGTFMWFFLGRPRRGGFRRPQGPDDDTDFLKSI
jgi:hypothetical protein